MFSKVFRWQPCFFKDCNFKFKELTSIDMSGSFTKGTYKFLQRRLLKQKTISYHKLGLKFQIWKQLTALIGYAKDIFTPGLIGGAWGHLIALHLVLS